MVWAGQVAEILASHGVCNPTSDDEWMGWASSLLYSPDLAFVPDPYGFSDWESWACRVAETL